MGHSFHNNLLSNQRVFPKDFSGFSSSMDILFASTVNQLAWQAGQDQLRTQQSQLHWDAMRSALLDWTTTGRQTEKQ